MADAGEDIGPQRARTRAAALTLSALLVGLAIAVTLLVTWQVHRQSTDAAVFVSVEETPHTKPPPSRRLPPLPPSVMSAIGRPADIPSDVAVARTLVCFGPHKDEHPECAPHWGNAPLTSVTQLPIGGRYAPPPITHVAGVPMPPGWQGIPPDPCVGHTGMVTVCIRPPDPPPPSQSPEEICEAGLIGPCHPPAFRPEDVAHTQHTD